MCGDEDDYDKNGVENADKECNTPCMGDARFTCGGSGRIMVYTGE